MPRDEALQPLTAGGALFARLRQLGVDYVFCNSGTDFPPIIEGLAAAERGGLELPSAMVVPHEQAAVAMAHGYYAATGRPQAVMVHTNVGLANGVMGMINAAADHVPLILLSGRTPVTEQGRFGARTVPIGWGQEMRDQHALVRETTKWDYELRFPEQVPALLDRGHRHRTVKPARCGVPFPAARSAVRAVSGRGACGPGEHAAVAHRGSRKMISPALPNC